LKKYETDDDKSSIQQKSYQRLAIGYKGENFEKEWRDRTLEF
jgi:hypothetical protein